jgi:LPS export ABC transporter protein LptC
MRTRKQLAPIPCVVLCLLLAGCSLDYRPLQGAEQLREETPDAILINFTHTVVSGGALVRTLQAERAEIYDRKKETHLQKVYWVEYDEDGGLLSEAWADRAVWRPEREEAEVYGNIRLHSFEDRAWIHAQSLFWAGEGRVLTSRPEEPVVLEKENGSRVEGKGFQADFRRRRIEFAFQVQGTYVSEE